MSERRANLEILTEAEDIAREIRNRMKQRTTAVVPSDIANLATVVAAGFQAIRELLEGDANV